jgi:hypothetical protein
MTLFARYSWSPSNGDSRASEFGSPNQVTRRDSRSNGFTAGWTRASSASLLHDLRFNYSATNSRSGSAMDNFGGAVPLTEAQVFPKGVSGADGSFNLSILGAGGYSIASRSRSEQKQANVVYSLSKTGPAHTVKFGADFRRIMPTNHPTPYSLNVTFNGISGDKGALVSAIATNAQVSSSLPAIYPLYSNFSAYVQDTYRATERTTLTYGVRWDVNPAPGVRQGPRPLAVSDSTIAGVTQNEPLYQTRWLDVAPRFGLAYQMDTTQGREMMFRMGIGLFYDTGYGTSSGAFGGAPYSSVRTISLATFPLSSSDAAPPSLPPTRPYGQVISADTNLKSPIVPQWNLTIERYIGAGQMFSVGYVGNKGRRLLRSESRPSFSDAYDILRVATNGATSDYHGLQVQFRKRFSAALQTQFSYTYAHSIDSASSDIGGGFASLFGGGERGSSDYDIRHNLNFSGSYRLPAPSHGPLGLLLKYWFLDWVAAGRTGLPFDVQGVSGSSSNTTSTVTTNLRNGLFAQVRATYNGKRVWIYDSKAPGGRRLNSAAFEAPTGFSQGNLGRNALRGFGTFQTDLAVRRQIAITERLRLNISAQAFNAFNNPNFANPSPNEGANLSSPNFGVMTRMLNSSFGGGGNSLYRSGGPRSAELALRLQF